MTFSFIPLHARLSWQAGEEEGCDPYCITIFAGVHDTCRNSFREYKKKVEIRTSKSKLRFTRVELELLTFFLFFFSLHRVVKGKNGGVA